MSKQSAHPQRLWLFLKPSITALSVLCIGSFSIHSAFAANTDDALKSANRTVQQAQQSQQRINKLDDSAQSLLSKYQQQSRYLDDLQTYNQQMQALVAQQQRKKTELQDTLLNVATTERQITPLLLRMIAGLDEFIKLDLPFLTQERTERVKKLRRVMDRPDVNLAEKFREVFEAYEIELAYSNTMESYRGTLPGSQLDVEFLRIGRIGLMFQTLDGSGYGTWNRETRQWDAVDAAFQRDIRKGIRMAKQQMTADLIKIPLNAASPKTSTTNGKQP